MRIVLFVISLFISVSQAASERIAGSSFQAGVWYGDAFTNNETGKWSHCTVTGEYGNGYNLTFSLNSDYNLGVYLTNRNDPVFKGVGEIEVVTQVDRFKPIFATVLPNNDFFAGVWYEDLDTAIDQFKRGRTLMISSRLGNIEFGLKGSFRALDAAYRCASKYQNHKGKPSTVASNSETSQEVVWTPNSTETAAMYQLATLLIKDFGLDDFRFLVGEDKLTPAVEFKANGDTIYGIVSVGRVKGDFDLNEEMANDVGSLTSKFCDDGDIAVINSTKVIEGVKTKSLRGICDSPSEPFTAYVTKQAISKTLVETIIFDYAQTELSGTYEDQTTTNVGYIAAKFVTID